MPYSVLPAVSLGVVVAVVLLDSFGHSKIAGHIVDLAKFVLPTMFAADAVVTHSESRRMCCVIRSERDEDEGSHQAG
jgi:hypothetical protein